VKFKENHLPCVQSIYFWNVLVDFRTSRWQSADPQEPRLRIRSVPQRTLIWPRALTHMKRTRH